VKVATSDRNSIPATTSHRAVVGPAVRVLPLVKANAYGSGLVEAARALVAEVRWGVGVATVPEGLALRDAGIGRPILVGSPMPRADLGPAFRGGLPPCVSDVETLEAAGREAADVSGGASVHLEVDTGMGRSGFD